MQTDTPQEGNENTAQNATSAEPLSPEDGAAPAKLSPAVERALFSFENGLPKDSLQARLAEWQSSNFGIQDIRNFALGVGEEVGELQHCILKRFQSIRGMYDDDVYLDSVGDAIADTAVYLMQLSTALGLDFELLVDGVARDVMRRNWKENRDNGA